MKIKELKEEHPDIYKIAMNYLRQLPIGIIDQANPDMDDFNWHKTSEGFTFWSSIEDGNFQVFYDRYPEHSKQPVNVEETPEPKAGDMVEVYDFDNQEWLTLEMRYLGVTTSTGAFVCENRNFATETFSKIRLPQKSEVESKAEEIQKRWRERHKHKLSSLQIIVEAIKWGQQNPNAK